MISVCGFSFMASSLDNFVSQVRLLFDSSIVREIDNSIARVSLRGPMLTDPPLFLATFDRSIDSR